MEQSVVSTAKFVTSLVPHLRRFDRNGRDIGAEYQGECLDSWLSTGAGIVSVNTDDEAETLRRSPLFEKLDCVFTSRDGGVYPNRYGPTLGVVFDSTVGAKTVGLFNADTFIPKIGDFLSFISSEARDQFILARRTDVESPGGRFLGINDSGIDAIFFGRSRFAPVFEAPELRCFQLGVPWWDLIIPVAASFYGPLAYIPEPFLLHMDHSKAWSGESYRRAGDLAREAILTHAKNAAALSEEASKFVREFSAFQEKLEGLRLSKQLFECRLFYSNWIWSRAKRRVIEHPGFLINPIMRLSVAATLERREPVGFRLAKLENDPPPGLVLSALGTDVSHALRLTGRHLERWCRYKIKGKSFSPGKALGKLNTASATSYPGE